MTLIGMVDKADGIGSQAVEHYELLKDAGGVNVIPTRIRNKTDVSFWENLSFFNPFVKAGKIVIFEEHLPGRPEKPITLDSLFIADKGIKKQLRKFQLRDINDSIKIAYSMTESTLIMRHWVKAINDIFDAVIVPDEFLVKVYKDSGVTKPIFVLPLAVDLKDHIGAPIKDKAHEIFTYGNFNAIYQRKNLDKLIEAFKIVHKKLPNTQLLIRSRAMYSPYAYAKMMEILDNSPGLPVNIEIKGLNRKEYNETFLRIDCYVSPSLGEGFSIIPRQTMARGIPTIVTDNTGQSVIAHSELAKAVRSDILIPGYYDYLPYPRNVGYQFDCDTIELAEAMIEVYEHYNQYLSRSQEMRNWSQQYDIQHPSIKARYQNIMLKPKKLLLGDKNEVTNEYLMTNSKELYQKYQQLIISPK